MAKYKKIIGVPKVLGETETNIVNKILDQIVQEYDSTKTYAEGDYVIFKGQIYKAKVIVSAGAGFVEDNWKKLETAEEYTTLLISKGQAGAVIAEDSKLLGGKPKEFFASKESLEGMYEGQAIRDLLVRSRPLFRFPSFRETAGMREYSNNGHPIISMAIQKELSTVMADVNLKPINPTAPIEDLDNVTLRIAPTGSVLSGRTVMVKEAEWLRPDNRYLVHVTAKMPPGVNMGLYQNELGTDREVVYYGNMKGTNKYKSYYIYFKTGADSVPHAQVKLQLEGTYQPSQVSEIRYIQAFDLDGTNADFVTWMKVLSTMQSSMPMIMNPAFLSHKPGENVTLDPGKSPCTVNFKRTKEIKAASIPTYLGKGARESIFNYNNNDPVYDGGQCMEVTFTENSSPLSDRYVIFNIMSTSKTPGLDFGKPDEDYTNYGVVVFKVVADIPKNARLAIFDNGKPLPNTHNPYRIVDHLGGRNDGRGSGFAETYYIVAESKYGPNNGTAHDFKLGFVDFRSGTTAKIYFVQEYWSVFPRDQYMFSRFLGGGSSSGGSSSPNNLTADGSGNVNIHKNISSNFGLVNKNLDGRVIQGIKFLDGSGNETKFADVYGKEFIENGKSLENKYMRKDHYRNIVSDANNQYKPNDVIAVDYVNNYHGTANIPANIMSGVSGGTPGIGTLLTLCEPEANVGGQILIAGDTKTTSGMMFRVKNNSLHHSWKQVLTRDDVGDTIPSRTEFENLKHLSVSGKGGLVDRLNAAVAMVPPNRHTDSVYSPMTVNSSFKDITSRTESIIDRLANSGKFITRDVEVISRGGVNCLDGGGAVIDSLLIKNYSTGVSPQTSITRTKINTREQLFTSHNAHTHVQRIYSQTDDVKIDLGQGGFQGISSIHIHDIRKVSDNGNATVPVPALLIRVPYRMFNSKYVGLNIFMDFVENISTKIVYTPGKFVTYFINGTLAQKISESAVLDGQVQTIFYRAMNNGTTFNNESALVNGTGYSTADIHILKMKKVANLLGPNSDPALSQYLGLSPSARSYVSKGREMCYYSTESTYMLTSHNFPPGAGDPNEFGYMLLVFLGNTQYNVYGPFTFVIYDLSLYAINRTGHGSLYLPTK